MSLSQCKPVCDANRTTTTKALAVPSAAACCWQAAHPRQAGDQHRAN